MPNYKDTTVTIAIVSLGALCYSLLKHLLDIEKRKDTERDRMPDGNSDRTMHEIVRLDEDALNASAMSTCSDARDCDQSAERYVEHESFGPLTSTDIAIGFYIIREWEFTKYEFNGREREIARMMMDGMSNKQIAVKVCLGESSVKYHISSIFRKTSLKNRKDFGTLIKRGMQRSTRQWASRREMNKELELLRNRKS